MASDRGGVFQLQAFKDVVLGLCGGGVIDGNSKFRFYP
jgi:hypothetical protein